MWSLVFVVCCLVLDLTQANGQCWCTDSDLAILNAPTHNAVTVDVLTSGSCLNSSQFEYHEPWIAIKTTEKSGFVHQAYGISLRDCTYSGLMKRQDCPSYCMDTCCLRAGMPSGGGEHHHHSHHGCDACASSCCVQTNNFGSHSPEWSSYGACSVSCGEGIQSRYCTAHCTDGNPTEVRVCKIQDCPPEWSSYGDCSVTCGQGVQTRYCSAHCSDGNPTEVRVCNVQDCPPEYSSYGTCSVTCGEGIQTRICTAHCSPGSHPQVRSCKLQECPPVWSSFGDCSVTCGDGIQTRYCAAHCSHSSPTDIRPCKVQDCPPVWSAFGDCSVTCGDGIQTQFCTAHCSNVNQPNIRVCRKQDCPPEWSAFGDCSVTCGVGTQIRYCAAHCSQVSPTDVRACKVQDCPAAVHLCDKFGTIQALAEQNVTSQVHCADRWTSGTDKFVYTHCHNAPSDTMAWRQGDSVLNDCKGSKSIQPYTPIGTFTQMVFTQGGHSGISGIFISCTARGFKMATEACGGGAEVIDIPHYSSAVLSSDALLSNNPGGYYTIKW